MASPKNVEKECSFCGKKYLVEKQRKTISRWCSYSCNVQSRKQISKRTKEARKLANKKKARAHYWKKEYGITPAQWFKMYRLQQGLCPICLKPIPVPDNPQGKRAAAVEHDHKTKRVRGLVCHVCNRTRIGTNTLETARRLIVYLERNLDARDL